MIKPAARRAVAVGGLLALTAALLPVQPYAPAPPPECGDPGVSCTFTLEVGDGAGFIPFVAETPVTEPANVPVPTPGGQPAHG